MHTSCALGLAWAGWTWQWTHTKADFAVNERNIISKYNCCLHTVRHSFAHICERLSWSNMPCFKPSTTISNGFHPCSLYAISWTEFIILCNLLAPVKYNAINAASSRRRCILQLKAHRHVARCVSIRKLKVTSRDCNPLPLAFKRCKRCGNVLTMFCFSSHPAVQPFSACLASLCRSSTPG